MNNKGFISISVVYSFFVVFMMLLLFIVDGYVNNRNLIKKIAEQVTKDAIVTTFCEAHYNEKVCLLYTDYDPIKNNHNLLYHNASLTNGAGDFSYRYVGNDPKNYVCFGPGATASGDCPSENLYRIIGIIPVDVKLPTGSFENGQSPIVRQQLYKLIKHEYITSSEIGITPSGVVSKEPSASYTGPSGNQPSGDVAGFLCGSELTFEYNTWCDSNLFLNGLNGSYLNHLDITWSNKIAEVNWAVGGNKYDAILTVTPMSTVYTNEIINTINDNSLVGDYYVYSKVNMLYVSDYGYAAPSTSWSTALGSYFNSTIIANNWLYKGVMEWTGTRDASNKYNQFRIGYAGEMLSTNVKELASGAGVRPVFFLKDEISISNASDVNVGSKSNPYRVS